MATQAIIMCRVEVEWSLKRAERKKHFFLTSKVGGSSISTDKRGLQNYSKINLQINILRSTHQLIYVLESWAPGQYKMSSLLFHYRHEMKTWAEEMYVCDWKCLHGNRRNFFLLLRLVHFYVSYILPVLFYILIHFLCQLKVLELEKIVLMV